jgi:aromatic-L-amino-acid/L-tryptophan decarboxylase
VTEFLREWTADEIRELGGRTVELIVRHLADLPRQPAFSPVPREVRERLGGSCDRAGGSHPSEILDEFAELIEPYPFGNGHPAFFGWVNSPPLPIAVFAEALAAAMNPSCAGGNHAAVYVEEAVTRWFKTLFGFPDTAKGLFVSGGSMATLNALTVARHVALRGAGWDVRRAGLAGFPRRLVVYKTREGHSCVQKAVELLGLGSDSIRIVAHDDRLRMKPDALDAMIREDLAAGALPCAVVATAGTVNTGAIDPLSAIADVCDRHGVWLHVDGAYGAPAILSKRYHDEMAPIARADSLAIDPHKWLFVPVEAGLVIVRDAAAMRDAFSLVPPYLRTDGNVDGVGGPVWFSEFGFQQTRSFRALKTWMAVKQLGERGYAQAIDATLSLADRLARRLQELPEIEVLEPRSLSIVCFRHVPRTLASDQERLNTMNERLLEQVQLGGAAFLSGTRIGDVFWLRACVVNHRTRDQHVDRLAAVLAELTLASTGGANAR